MLKYARIFTLTLFLLASLPVMAAEVGENIPHALKVSDQNGEIRDFNALKGEKGAVLMFIRSADWCPFCQTQLIDLSQHGKEIEELGYSLITISYDAPEKLKAFSEKNSFDYTMLSDKKSEVIKAFGVLNELVPQDTFYYGIPNPTIFVVNANGVISDILAEEGYKERPPVEAIVEAIKD